MSKGPDVPVTVLEALEALEVAEVASLETPRLQPLCDHLEGLIRENRAGLEAFELYVRCRLELIERQASTSGVGVAREHPEG